MQTWLHTLLPHRLISRVMGWVAESRCAKVRLPMIRWFVKRYQVDMSEAAVQDLEQYASFNDFFTRALRAGARTIDVGEKTIISPVDGAISEYGTIEGERLLQAKGRYYDLPALLGGDQEHARVFENGRFLTAYLAPKDYHRIHMPFSGQLQSMVYVPGRIFSVNQESVCRVPNLFARNERVICFFETAFGPMAVIAVGAMIVGSIATAWHGVVNAPRAQVVQRWDYAAEGIALEKGDELGFFKMGSTVILLFPHDAMAWSDALQANQTLRLGQVIGTIN